MFKHITKNKAFTLIELIVVMAVIGILVLLAAPKFKGYTEKARLTELKNNIRQLENASERYYIKEQDWPRASDEHYTAQELEEFAQEIKNRTGAIITLDPEGKYYPIDYDKLQKYVQKPKDGVHYILQNPVGEVFYLDDLTEKGKEELSSVETPKTNRAPIAVISMDTHSLSPNTPITWDYVKSTDPDGDKIVNFEWDGKQDVYTTPGEYTVRLRVQDSKGLWSDWTSITFTISNRGPEPLQTEVPEGWIAINSIDDLAKIGKDASYPLDGKYILMRNLDFAGTVYFTGEGWLPIANFKGQFDGNGLVIDNLMINRPTTDYVGLFGKTTSPIISNLTLSNVDIKGAQYVGALIGQGISKPITTRIKVTGNITGTYAVGGLIGGYYMNNSKNIPLMDQCIMDGTVSGTNDRIGGLIGLAAISEITNCYVMGTLEGPSDTTPFVGYNAYGDTKVKYSYVKIDYVWLGYSREGNTIKTNVYGNNFDSTTPLTSHVNTLLSKALMMKKSSYSGFDFTNIWSIQEGVDYPRLQWESK